MAAPSARSQQVTGCQGGAAGAQLLSRLLGILGKATPGFAPWVRHFCLYLSERSKNPCSYTGDDPTSNDPRVFVDELRKTVRSNGRFLQLPLAGRKP